MGYLATDTGSGGSNFEPVSEGTHFARCVRVVDLGDQEDVWKGVTNIRSKIHLGFEVPGETATWQDKDGNEQSGPKMIGQTLTLSIGEKAKLRRWLESWRGKKFTPEELRGFDIFNVLDKPCLITVLHKAKGDGNGVYGVIENVTRLPSGMQQHPRVSPLQPYSPEHPEFNKEETRESLPKWMRETMDKAVADPEAHLQAAKQSDEQEYAQSGMKDTGVPPAEDAFEDSIPF